MLHFAGIFAGVLLSVAGAGAAGAMLFPRSELPRAIRFVNGVALFSGCIFGLLACGAGYWWSYSALCGLLLVAAWRSRPAGVHPLARMPWFIRCVLGGYGVFYLVYALAPEIQPDAFGYHLRLVSEYVRVHGLTNRLMFYDVMPQGLEMLFVPAFALGGAAAAKVVHLVLLCMTVPLVREIGREAGIPDRAGAVGAALLFLAPVCGVAGTAAYTDAGLVCACCAVVYLVLRWDRERGGPALLACAGLNAGFCYAVKPTFGWVALAGLAVIGARGRRLVPVAVFAAGAAATALPWVARAYWLTGDPVAPFLSGWFPNTVSTPGLERALTDRYAIWRPEFHGWPALFDYTVAGGHQGLLGAGFLLLPLGGWSLRHRAGRRLLASAALLAVPVAFNTGTRFLLPAMAPASLALAAVLPGPVGLAVVGVQALASAPPVMELYDRRYEWRLGAWPLAAALGSEPEHAYLHRTVPGFGVTELLKEKTRPEERILAMAAVPEVYIPRELLVFWQSVEAQKLTDALHFAQMSHGTRARLLSWRWNGGEYRALRLRARSEVRVVEAHLLNGPQAAQGWASVMPGGMVEFAGAGNATGADLLIWPGDQAKEDTEGLGASGVWETIGVRAERAARVIDLRRDATAYVRRSGFSYVLIPVAGDAMAELGAEMMTHPAEWGVESVGHRGDMWLFRILPALL